MLTCKMKCVPPADWIIVICRNDEPYLSFRFDTEGQANAAGELWNREDKLDAVKAIAEFAFMVASGTLNA